MSEQEIEDITNSLWPVGQERWIKVKYLDQKKVIKAFWMPMNNSNRANELAADLGYQVTAVGVRDEYIPQVSALMDIKSDIIATLYGMPDHVVEHVHEIIKNKIEELKRYTINNNPHRPSEIIVDGN